MSLQYVATLSPEAGSFLTQVTPAVRTAFVVLFDLCLEVYPEEVNDILRRSVEEVLKDPRLSVNKTYAGKVRRMVFEFSLTYPAAFYGKPGLEALQALIKTQKGEEVSVSRIGTCRSPWVRSLIENIFKIALEGLTPETRGLMLKDWVVLTREELKDNRKISDFKELAEIVLARFDSMELFQELLTPVSKPKTVIEVDAEKVEEELEPISPEARRDEIGPLKVFPVSQTNPYEEFFTTGEVTTASPEHQIYPGFLINYERGGRRWDMYQHLVDSPHRVTLDAFDDEIFITILTATYRENGILVHEGGKITFNNRRILSSDMSAFIRVDAPKEYMVRSQAIQPGNEYIVTTWKNLQGMGDQQSQHYRVSFYQGVNAPHWQKVTAVENPNQPGQYVTLWFCTRIVYDNVPTP